MEKHVLTFIKVKETKNTFKYDEVPEPGKAPVLNNVYIFKWALPADRVQITVEEVK